MNKKTILIIIGIFLAIGIAGGVLYFLQKPTVSDIPYYFIAIHNEPYHDEFGEAEKIETSYLILRQMIEKADEYNIKLTLMFTPQWADYISESPERMAELKLWEKQGHEIAAHHHSIYHGNWDGYTNYSPEEAKAQRIKQGKKPETYLGTLTDYINKLKKINLDIDSGCVNDEHDKKVMPDEIVYDTCSGFANFGEPGQLFGDGNSPEKGNNEYVTVGTYNGIQRKWLAHYQITTDNGQKSAQVAFSSINSGVYGAVTHSISGQDISFYDYLEFLHSKDLTGGKSRTVSEIIEQKLLPEERIFEKLINKKTQTPYSSKKQGMCGDFICDEIEKANPNLCPEDCGNNGQMLGPNYTIFVVHVEPHPCLSNGQCKILYTQDDQWESINWLIQTAEKYNSRLTIELSGPFVEYVEKRGYQDDVLGWIQKGHEIGTHYHDANPNEDDNEKYDLATAVNLVDDLVGEENNNIATYRGEYEPPKGIKYIIDGFTNYWISEPTFDDKYKRYKLSHGLMGKVEGIDRLKIFFENPSDAGGVIGVVTHATPAYKENSEVFEEWFIYLHDIGKETIPVSKVMEKYGK